MLASRPESRSPLGAALGMGHGPRGTPSSDPLRPPQRPHGARAQREPEVLPGEEMAENQLGTDPLSFAGVLAAWRRVTRSEA